VIANSAAALQTKIDQGQRFMAQIFDRSSNALARASLVLTGLIVIALGVTLDQLQRSPWVTRQGQRPDQPVPFSHKHHVQGLGLQCQYCHVTVEKSSYAGIPPTKTCINCHQEIWTNAQLLEPVRSSWATGQSLVWTKVHDLPDFVYFSHEIHVNKGMGCSSCHGRVDLMPLMYEQNTLQMEWCLDCHRNPAKNIRPTSEIYNMAWEKPAEGRPVWCAVNGDDKSGVPTAESVSCVTKDPAANPEAMASLTKPALLQTAAMVSDAGPAMMAMTPLTPGQPAYQKFTDQDELGHFLVDHYKIRTPKDLTSCEVCHR
jgi:Cytochrome c7 and related cytochrome c